jgi:dynein heavy chain
MEEDWKEI